MKSVKVFLSVLFVGTLSCSMYHLQTPETVSPGHITGGAGLLLHTSGPYVYPGGWVRTGLTPRMDIGLSSWLLGAKAEIKYRPFKFLAVGVGFGGGYAKTLMESYPKSMGLFVGEGSLYLGFPFKQAFPYCVVRASELVATDASPVSEMTIVTAVFGSRAPLAKNVSLYIEGGGMYYWGAEIMPIGGIGLSFGE